MGTPSQRDVTCRMGSHSVTSHPTQVNAPHLTPAMQAGTPQFRAVLYHIISYHLEFLIGYGS